MLRRVWLHRRRLVFGFLAFVVLGLTTDWGLTLQGIRTAVTIATAMILFFALVIIVRPRSAMIVELFSLTLLLHQGFFALSPFLDHMVWQASPLIRLGFLLMLYYLLFNIATAANGFRWPGTIGVRARRTVDAPRETVWRMMTPSADRAHWDAEVTHSSSCGEGLRLGAAQGAMLVTDGTLEIVEQEEEKRFRLTRRQPPDGPDRGIGLTERLTLTHRRGGTQIELARTYTGLPLMTALNLWLSGHPGEMLDAVASRLRGGSSVTETEAAQPGVPTSPTIW